MKARAGTNGDERERTDSDGTVENKAGVLARFVGLFARRGFNISALAVAPTDDERFSRITFIYEIGTAQSSKCSLKSASS